jgi:hypothetical protein
VVPSEVENSNLIILKACLLQFSEISGGPVKSVAYWVKNGYHSKMGKKWLP